MTRLRWVIGVAAFLLLGTALVMFVAQMSAEPEGDVIENSIGMKLMYVPPGKFLMGSPAGEENRMDNEDPQHQVTLTKGFYLGKYEVTQAEYKMVMGTNPSYFCAEGFEKDKVTGQDTRRYPVECVSWEDAVEFCRRLSAKEGKEYRLPKEAEWEYACRGRMATPFHFGGILNGTQASCNGNFPYGTTKKGASLGRTTEVGGYAANAFGLCDMHGNVFEWCADWYNEKEYQRGDCVDPKGPTTGSFRVFRGGCWLSEAGYCRSALRDRGLVASPSVGFRVCLSSVVK